MSEADELYTTRYSLAAVWEEILIQTFSTIGRMERLASCFDSRTRLYAHARLAHTIGAVEANAAIRAAHGLVWNDWLAASLERQQLDLLVHASEGYETIETFVTYWQISRPYLTFPPGSAETEERFLFAGNLEVLLERLRNQYCADTPLAPAPIAACPVIQLVLDRVHAAYADPDLSFDTLSGIPGTSKRSLYRKWKDCVGRSFGDYLAEVRIQKAVALLKESSFGIKAISTMVGYKDCNYFIRDFRKHMNCAPGQFRASLLLAGKPHLEEIV